MGATSLILYVTKRGKVDIIKKWLNKGGDVNAKNNEGSTALTVAAESGHTELVKLLLAKNADPNVKTENGWTVLMYASQHGHNDVIKALLGSGAKIEEKKKDGVTALIIASSNNQPETVRLLIAKGADVVAKDNDGWTALIYAVNKEHDEVVKLLEPYAKSELDYAYLAAYYHDKGDNKKADEYIEKAVRLNPNNSDVRFIQGNIFYKQKDYDNAIIAYKKTVELNPKGDNPWRKLALCYKEKKDYKKALESINKAIELSPEDYEFKGTQAELLLFNGDINNASRAYEKTLELLLKDLGKEKDAGKYSNASWYALFVSKFSDAERYAKECLTMDSKMYELYTNLGHSYLFQGKKSEALIEYRKHIEQDPEKGITKFVNVLKDDFSLLKKRYPDKVALIEWAEKELGIK